MPLPPLPDNNTDRAWLKYTSMGQEHELIVRFTPSTTQANIITAMTALANGLRTMMLTTDAFIGLRHQDAGSNLSFPLAWTNITGTVATTPEANDKAMYADVTGRSLGGYRTKVTFFSGVHLDSQGYRQNRAASTYADVFLDAIEGMPTQPVSKDNGAVVWNQYINIGFNAYWQKQLR